jgi:aminopeptidase YwaD
MLRILFVFLFISQVAVAQKLSKSDKALVEYLKSEVGYLASDELKGRRAGDPGETLAATFIASKFKEVGLTPKGDNADYFQYFTINDGKLISPSTFLTINGVKLEPGNDFYPLAYTKNGSAKGELSPGLHEKDQPWMVDLAESLEENKENPHFDINNFISDKIKSAKEKGASFVLFFNSTTGVDVLKFDAKDRSETAPLPVAFLTSKGRDRVIKEATDTYSIETQLSVEPKIRKSKNVVGFLDNKAQYTIIIGAHYDHLGYGEDGNSMIRGGEASIHNGADDNASGTSAMIELAFQLKGNKAKHYNYLFIGFSAEELGLNGSKYFVENPTISLNSVNYMINMDMVGRMNDSTKTITIGGYGTSPSWQNMIAAVKKKSFSVKFDSSGTGPSDHTSFYRKDIPVLFFFTGLHTDYHKPSDDADKINYVGIAQIVRFIQEMIENDKAPNKLVFTKTREQQTSTSTRFSVSMGIMPDYSYNGTGVRVDGVTDNRPAKKAGITGGDIVKQLGEFKTSSVEAYMQALSKFKKGDKTSVVVSRGEKELTFEIQF